MLGKIIGAVILVAITAFIFALPIGWLFMITVGVIHGSWWSAVPTIGFWWAVLVSFLLRIVFATYTQSK